MPKIMILKVLSLAIICAIILVPLRTMIDAIVTYIFFSTSYIPVDLSYDTELMAMFSLLFASVYFAKMKPRHSFIYCILGIMLSVIILVSEGIRFHIILLMGMMPTCMVLNRRTSSSIPWVLFIASYIIVKFEPFGVFFLLTLPIIIGLKYKTDNTISIMTVFLLCYLVGYIFSVVCVLPPNSLRLYFRYDESGWFKDAGYKQYVYFVAQNTTSNRVRHDMENILTELETIKPHALDSEIDTDTGRN